MTSENKLPVPLHERKTSSHRPGGVLGLSGRDLVRAVEQAETPETFVRSLPVQSLYLGLKYRGISDCGDLIAIASLEQTRLCMDFDLWHRDELNEEAFWQWLALDDEEHTLELLQKVLRCLDLKLLGVIIARYVEVVVQQEPTELPPGSGFYTPDKGYTWLAIRIEDENHHFLLGRFFALVFETDADLYYQLLSVPGVATPAMLEEEAFIERTKRLGAEGVPDASYSEELQSPLPRWKLKELLAQAAEKTPIELVQAIDPLVYEATGFIEPLSRFLETVGRRDEVESEITLLMNSAIVRWRVDFSDSEAIALLGSQVRGALNIGLEEALALWDSQDFPALYEHTGLKKLFQAGLWRLLEFRKAAIKAKSTLEAGSDPVREALIEEASKPFPLMPKFVGSGGVLVHEEGRLATGARAIETIEELENLQRLLQHGTVAT